MAEAVSRVADRPLLMPLLPPVLVAEGPEGVAVSPGALLPEADSVDSAEVWVDSDKAVLETGKPVRLEPPPGQMSSALHML